MLFGMLSTESGEIRAHVERMTFAGNSTPATSEQSNDSLDLYDIAADRLTFRVDRTCGRLS